MAELSGREASCCLQLWRDGAFLVSIWMLFHRLDFVDCFSECICSPSLRSRGVWPGGMQVKYPSPFWTCSQVWRLLFSAWDLTNRVWPGVYRDWCWYRPQYWFQSFGVCVIVTSPPEGVARYCFHPVCLSVCLSLCVCVCVCLSVCLCVCVSDQYFGILFSAIRRDIDLKFIQDTYRDVLNSQEKYWHS